MKKNEIKTVNESLVDYLISKLNNGQYDTRTYYGELFTALAMAKIDVDKYSEHIEKILDHYFNNEDKTDDQFHWEFNNYALIELERTMDLSKYVEQYKPLKFKGTQSSNWIMLRGLTRILARENKTYGVFELKKTIILMQKKNGLIMDSIYDKSFQYHCFMAYLILEAYNETKDTFYKKSFLKALNFIEKFILRNGDFSYIGRGQKQIFGVGPLLYILQEGYKITNDQKYLFKLDLVYKMLLSYRRDDGSFPLLLRKGEVGYPKVIDVNDSRFLGWYSYNNYFDYLPFLAYFLTKLDCNFSNFKISGDIENYQNQNGEFMIFRNSLYDAVISRPEGPITNGLPFPYIVNSNMILNICYGGEISSSLYPPGTFPLPWGILDDNKSSLNWKNHVFKFFYLSNIDLFRTNFKGILKTLLGKKSYANEYFFSESLIYKLKGSKIVGYSKDIKHVRDIKFHRNQIFIHEEILFRRKLSFLEFTSLNLFVKSECNLRQNICTLENGVKIEFIGSIGDVKVKNNCGYSACGNLNNIKVTHTNITFNKGYNLTFKYCIHLEEKQG